ncbi:TonB-dependent receptor [Sphingobium sp. 15-1]|uniref:TonB-dependent receptor n=1 Tax=Sphingobium sp. 15-1 TaxID=2729616 RepID=UPI0021008854|nr:TonB-dependent receptor [Sphingobium sp. 15-1]
MITNHKTLFGSISAIALLSSGQAMAQAAQASETENAEAVGDIVVTAQRREQNAQEVPIALTIFGGEALQDRAISDVSQLGGVTPNVSLDAGTPFAGSSAALGASIRGIGQNDFAVNVDPGVGVYIDGIFLARTVGANVTLPDVERVEILKGPQGTLFGRNTIGGAINIVTRTPGHEFAIKGSVTAGSYNRFDLAATVDIPLADNLRTNVTFASNSRRGFQRRVPYTSNQPFVRESATVFRESGYDSHDDAGGMNDWSLRGKVLWEPSDRITATFTGDYYKSDTSGLPNVIIDVLEDFPGNFAGPGTPAVPFSALTPGTGFNFAGVYNFCIGSTQAQILARNAQGLCNSPRGSELFPGEQLPPLGSVNVDSDPNNNLPVWNDTWINADWDKSYATGINFSKTRTWGFSANLAYELSNELTVRSITGYRELEWSAGFDADNSPGNFFSVSNKAEQSQFSQEFQLLGDLDIARTKLNFVLGGYYFEEQASALDHVNIGGGIWQADGPTDLDTDSIAIFGQSDWRVSSWLGFTFGARYTRENKSIDIRQTDVSSFNYDVLNCPVNGTGFIPALGVVPCSTYARFPHADDPLRLYTRDTPDRKFTNFSMKAGIQLHPTDDIMIYGSYTEGYKSGGWSTRASTPISQPLVFSEESAKTFEAGVKSTFLGGRIRANLAAFTTEYDDVQLLLQVGANPRINNFGTATIRGIEADFTAKLNDNISLTSSLGVLDSKLKNLTNTSPPNYLQLGIVNGAELLKVPDFKFNISPRIELPVNDHNFVIQADYTYTSAVWNDSQRSFALRRPATNMVNASVAFEHDRGWSITGGVTNLTNERFIVNGLTSTAGQIYGSPNRPREYYVRLGFEF